MKHWGMELQLDLYDCMPEFIRDEKFIKAYVKDLCKLIDVKRFGETVVVNFGEDPRVSGYSMTQLIETSLISAHFINQTNMVCLNVFSCADFDAEKVVEFTMGLFRATKEQHIITYRGVDNERN